MAMVIHIDNAEICNNVLPVRKHAPVKVNVTNITKRNFHHLQFISFVALLTTNVMNYRKMIPWHKSFLIEYFPNANYGTSVTNQY